MSITLTESAAMHIKDNIFKDASQSLRFGVRESGCTGFRYILEIANDINDDDTIIECHGVKIVIDKESYHHVSGTEIDYVKQDFSEMFAFNNPKVAAKCGCGESFST